jgi:hypothetical protein
VIDFDADPRIPGDTTEPHVSWNGSGQTDDGTAGGNPITNASEQLERVLLLNGFNAAEIDAATVADAANALNVKQIKTGFVATDREITIGEVVRRFAESANLVVFPTNEGKVGLTAPTVVIDENAVLPEVEAISDIVRDSFEVVGPDDVAASLFANYEYNFYTQGFLSQLVQTNPQQISALGENVPLNTEHLYIRDSASMAAVATIKMFFLREQRQVVRVSVAPRWNDLLEIGNEIRLTHFAGPGEAGYDRRIFRVIGMSVVEVGGGSVATGLKLVDLTAEPFFSVPLGEFSALNYVSSDYFKFGRVARGRLRVALTPTAEPEPEPEPGEQLLEASAAGVGGVAGALEVEHPLEGAASGVAAVSPSLTVEGLVTDGLISEWKFDEGSGQTLADSVGSNDGTLGTTAGSENEDPAWVTEGLDFAIGTGDKQVRIPSFFNPGTDGSFSLFIVGHYDASNSSVATLFSQADGPSTGRSWLEINPTDQIRSRIGGGTPTITSPTVSTGWHSFCVTYDGSGNLRLYLDGGNESLFTSVSPESANGLMRIGISKVAGTGIYNDILSYALFYDKRIVLSEVSQNHTALKAILAGRGVSLP